jgi:hypothetical protein
LNNHRRQAPTECSPAQAFVGDNGVTPSRMEAGMELSFAQILTARRLGLSEGHAEGELDV